MSERTLGQQMDDAIAEAKILKAEISKCNDCEAAIRADERRVTLKLLESKGMLRHDDDGGRNRDCEVCALLREMGVKSVSNKPTAFESKCAQDVFEIFRKLHPECFDEQGKPLSLETQELLDEWGVKVTHTKEGGK